MNEKQETKNKNLEVAGQEDNMNIIKKSVLGIKNYFAENYRDHKFRKIVSLFVVLCFVINIANLPAFAAKDKKAKDNKERNERVIKTGKTDTSEVGLVSAKEAMRAGDGEGVSTMITIGEMSEEDVDNLIEIDAEGGVIKDKTNGKVVAVYNPETEQVLGYAGQSDIVYYQALVDRKKALRNGTENKIQTIGVAQQQAQPTEEISRSKSAEEIADAEGTVIGEYKKDEEASAKEEQPEAIETIEQESRQQIEQTQEYKDVVTELAKQSGEAEQDVDKSLQEALAGKTDEEKESVIGLLTKFFQQGGSIVNCAVEALSNVLNVVNKGVIGLTALLMEISTGAFVQNNADLLNAGDTQLMTSMATMQAIMEKYGENAYGYASDIDTFIDGLAKGESAIVWVNGDHYITVTKLENGNLTIADPNVNRGSPTEYTAAALKSVLNGQTAKDVNGIDTGVSYKSLAADGKIRALTASEGLRTEISKGNATEIGKEEMIDILGARTETRTGTRTVTKTGTRTVTKTREEERTATATATATATGVDSEGNTYTYTYEYTYEYTYTVTVEYEEEEEYEYEVEEEYTYEVEVPDEEEDQAKIDELAQQKEEEINNMSQEDFYKMLEDENSGIYQTEEQQKANEAREEAAEKEYQEMSDEEFQEAQDNGDVKVTKTTITIKDIKIDGQSIGADNVKAINDGGSIKNKESMSQLLKNLDTAYVVANAAGGSAKDISFDKESNNFTVAVEGVNGQGKISVSVAAIGTDSASVSTFISEYNAAKSMGNSLMMYNGQASSISFDKDNGWQLTAGSLTMDVTNIGTTAEDQDAFKTIFKANWETSQSDSEQFKADYDANKVYYKLSEQTGVDYKDVQTQMESKMEGMDEQTKTKSLSLLSTLLDNGVQAVNCAAESMRDILDGAINAGTLAIQALAIDIASGSFLQNNNAENSQIFTSMAAVQQVLKDNGEGDYKGYNVTDTEGIKAALKNGDNVLLCVDDGSTVDANGNSVAHFIALSQEGNDITVRDINKLDATVSAEGDALKNHLKDTYNFEGGNMLAKSAGTGSTELTQDQMQNITGAATTRMYRSRDGHSYNIVTTNTATGKSTTQNVKSYDTAKKIVQQSNKNSGKVTSNTSKSGQTASMNRSRDGSYYTVNTTGSNGKTSTQKFSSYKDAKKYKLGITSNTNTQAYKDANAILNASKNLNLNNTTPIFGYTGATGSTPSVMVGNIGTTGNTTLALSQINDYTKFSNSYNNALTFNNQLKDTGITATFKIDGNGVQATVSNGQTKVNVNMSDFQTFTKNDTGYCVVTGTTATQFNNDGTTIQVDLTAGTTTSQYDPKKFAEFAGTEGFDRALDYAKCFGAVKSIKGYDEQGAEIFTAKNVGYLASDHSIALEYTFAQDYKGDNVYFRNVKAGEQKVTVENFYHDQDGQKQSGMVYTAGAKKSGDAPYVANNGLKINANINGVEKVTSWSVDDDGNQVAKTISFTDGQRDIDGDGKNENCASAFEVATVGKDGSVSVTRHDLTDAYVYPPVKNNNDGGSDGNEESLIEQYRQVLEDANSVQVSAHNDDKDFYSGYKYIKEDGYIDTSKITTRSYDSSSPNSFTQHGVEIGNGNEVDLTVEFEGDDWTKVTQIADNTTGRVSYRGENGETYSVSVEIKDGKKWTDLSSSNAKFKDDAVGVKSFGGTPVYSNTKFSYDNGFETVDFSVEAINTEAKKVGQEGYTPKYFYADGDGNYIGGVRIDEDNTVVAVKNADIQCKDNNKFLYVGKVENDTEVSVLLTEEGKKNQENVKFTISGQEVKGANGENIYVYISNEKEGIKFGEADFSNSDANFIRTPSGLIVSGIEIKSDGTAVYKNSSMNGKGEDGNTYSVTLKEGINGKAVSADFKYKEFVPEDSIVATEDGKYWRKTGSYSDEKGFSGATFGNTSDYFRQIDKTTTIYNIKKTASGTYVSQSDDPKDKNKHTYLLREEYNSGTNQKQYRQYSIAAGITIDDNYIQNDLKGLFEDNNIPKEWKMTKEQYEELASGYEVVECEKTESGFCNAEDHTTVLIKYKQFNSETGKLEEKYITIKADETTLLVGTVGCSVTVNGKSIDCDACWGWDGPADTLYQTFENGKIDWNDEQMAYLNAAGISIDKYENVDGQNLSNVVITITDKEIIDGKTFVNVIQNTYSYTGDNFSDVKNIKADGVTKTSIKVGKYEYNENEQLQTGKDLFLYNASGYAHQAKLDGGVVVGGAVCNEQVTIINNRWAGSMVTDGLYTDFVTGLEHVVSHDMFLSTNYVTIVGEYISGLNDKDLLGAVINVTAADGTELSLRPYYQNNKIIYNCEGWDKQTKTANTMEDAEQKRQEYIDQGYTVGEIESTTYQYQGYGEKFTVYHFTIEKNDISFYEFKGDFEGNEDAQKEYKITSIEFDPSSGFTVYAELNLDYTPFKTKGDINAAPTGDGGEEPEKVNESRYSVAGSIDGENINLARYNDSSDSKVEISFGLKEIGYNSTNNVLQDNIIQGHTFSKFYAGTDFYFTDPSKLQCIDNNTFDLKNNNVDAGTGINKTFFVNVGEGSHKFLNTDTTLAQFTTKIIEEGVDSGSADVTALITIKNDNDDLTTIIAKCSLEEGKGWEDSGGKKFGLVNSKLGENGDIEYEFNTANGTEFSSDSDKLVNYVNNGSGDSLAENDIGNSVLGGSVNNGKIDFGFWGGAIDLNSSITSIKIEKDGFARVLECAWGVVVSVTALATFGMTSLFGGPGEAMLKYSASLLGETQYDEVTAGQVMSAMFAGVAAIAAIAVAVVSIIASPFTAGASAVGGLTLAGYIIGAAIGTTVAAVGAGQAAFNASENLQMYAKTGNDAYLKAGLINLGLAIFSIVTAGMAADFAQIGGSIGAALAGKSALYAAASAAASVGGKEAAEQVVNAYTVAFNKAMARGATKAAAKESAELAAKYMAKSLGADVSKIVIKGVSTKGMEEVVGNTAANGVKTNLISSVGNGVKTALKNPWGQRATLLLGSSAIDQVSKWTGQSGWLTDLSRVFSIQGMLGLEGHEISDNSWLNNNVFGIDGLTWGSVLWVGGYVFGPSIASGLTNGISNFVSNVKVNGFGNEIASLFSNFGTNLSKFGSQISAGWRESVANIGKLVGGSGGGVTGALQAWGSLGTNMYRMVALNIGMGLTGSGLRTLGIVGNEDSAFSKTSLGSLLSFVFGEMGVDANGHTLTVDQIIGNSLASESLANSAMFGVLMYAFMPLASGIAKGIRGTTVAEEAAAGNTFTKLLDGAKEFANSIWEEGFKENIVQAAVTPFVGAQAAEYVSEFFFANTNGSASYFENIQFANSSTYSGARAAATAMTQLYASNGYGDITFNAVQNSDGSFGIAVSGLQGAANNILREKGITDISAVYDSYGKLSFVANESFSGSATERTEALSKARSEVAQVFGISEDSLAPVSGKANITSISRESLSSVVNKYTIHEMSYGKGEKAQLQSEMIGVYNAMNMPGFSGNITSVLTSNDGNFANNKAVESINTAIDEGTAAAEGITPSQISMPKIGDVFWKGDTRTRADMTRLSVNAARINQMYGSNNKFDSAKFNDQTKDLTTDQQLEQLTSVITLSQPSVGVNMEGFITGEQLGGILSSMIQDAKTDGAKAEVRMQIAQWGAMLAKNGLVSSDTMKVIAEELGIYSISEQVNDNRTTSTLASFGVVTVEQANTVATYVAMIQNAAGIINFNNLGSNIITETTRVNERVQNIERQLEGKSYNEQRQILSDNIKATNVEIDGILYNYLNDRMIAIVQDIVKKNTGEFKIVSESTKEGYELVAVKGSTGFVQKFEIFVNGESFGTFSIASLYDMGVIDNSNIKFSYNNGRFSADINGMQITGVDVYSLLQNQQFRKILNESLGENDNAVLADIVRSDIADYGMGRIQAELNFLGVENINTTDVKIAREQLAEKLVDMYSENLEAFVLAHTDIFTGNTDADSLRLVSQETIDASKGKVFEIKDSDGNDGRTIIVSLADSVAMNNGLNNRLGQLGTGIQIDDLLSSQDLTKLFNNAKKGKISQLSDDTTINVNGTKVTLGEIADYVGFGGDNIGLVVRLGALAEYKNSGEYVRAEQINKDNALWYAQNQKTEGGLAEGKLDEFRKYVNEKYESQEDKLLAVRLFANQMLMESGIYGKGNGLRASQMELLSALLGNKNAALDMGGGKTISLVVDSVVDRILMGDKANFEILVGNGAIGNYVGTNMQTFLQFVGMDMVAITDFKTSNDIKAEELLEAYNDPNKVMIMDPTTRGHLKNDAATKGGEAGRLIDSALNSVRRVVTDEIHLWALTRTASVISNGSYATSEENIKSARNMYDKFNVKEVLSNLAEINNYKQGIVIDSLLGEYNVVRFRSFNDWIEYRNQHSNESIMAIIGESSADVQVVFNGAIESTVNKDGSINNGELLSFARGLFTASDMGGAAFGEDGTVKPVSTKIENDMVISDIFFQMGYAANAWALEREQTNKYDSFEEFVAAATRESDTSMQTSLAAIYDGANQMLSLVGVSGTVLGLEQLIINRTGSSEVYVVSGSRANIQGQNIVKFDSTSNGYRQQLIDNIHDRITETLKKENTDILMLAKTAPSIDIFMEAIKSLDSVTLAELEKQGFVVFDRTTDTKYEIKNGTLDESQYNYDNNGTDESNRDQTAKDTSIRKIIIDNDAGATGTDYQGDYSLFVLDSHMYSNTDLAQLLQRVGRPNPQGTGRGEATRFILQDISAVKSKLGDYLTNKDFVEFFVKASNGDTYLNNSRAAELFNEIVQQNNNGTFEIRAEVFNNLDNESVQKDLLELTTFMTEISNINASIRFAVSDAVKDKLIIKPLRTMLAQAQTAEEKAVIRKALDDVLGKGGYDESAKLTGRESAQDMYSDKGGEYIQNTISSMTQQAQDLFKTLREQLSSDSIAYAQIAQHLAEMDSVNMSNVEKIKTDNLQKIANGENIYSLSQAESLEDFMGVIMTFENYIAPTLAGKMVEVSTVTNETVQQELMSDDAIKQGLVVERDGQLYLTELGQNYAKLAENRVNNTSSMVAKAFGVILAMLLGGGAYQPPEEEKEQTLALAKALQDNGITNVEGINNLINMLSLDSTMLVSVENGVKNDKFGIAELKNIVNASHPQGMTERSLSEVIKAEVSLPTAQAVALRRFVAGSSNELVKAYDSLVDEFYSTQSQRYALTSSERAQLFMQGLQDKAITFREKHPAAATATEFAGKLVFMPLSMLTAVPRFAIMGAVGKLLPFGNSQTSSIFAKGANSFIGYAASDFMLNKNYGKKSSTKTAITETSSKNERQLTLPEKALAFGYTIKSFGDKLGTRRDLTKTTKKLSSLVNPTLSDIEEISTKSNSEIKSQMAMAGFEINENTDSAIDNMKWIQTNKPEVFEKIKLSDISGLEQLTGLVSLAKADENFDVALDTDMLKKITSGQTSVLALYSPELAYAIARDNMKITEETLDAMGENRSRMEMLIETESTKLSTKDISVATVAQIAADMNIDTDYAMALILPTVSDNSKAVSRFNAVKDTPYAKYAKVSDLNKDGNFTDTGAISEQYEKDLVSVMPFSSLSNNQLKKLGYGTAVSRAKEITERLGGSEEAKQFVDNLSLGVLNDADFAKELRTLVSKASRDENGVSASEIYRNKELPAKINSAYNNRDSQQSTPLTEVIFGKAEQPVTEQSAEQPVAQVEQTATPINCAVIAFRDIIGDPTAQLDTDKKAGDYMLDILMVAGGIAKVAQDTAISAAETVLGTSEKLGVLRGNLGEDYEYATVDEKQIDTLSGKSIALFTYTDKDASTGKTIVRGHVATVTSGADIKAVIAEGYTFGGVVLADKQTIESNNSVMKTVYNPEDEIMNKVMSKFSKQSDILQQTLSSTLYGVTNPQELNNALAAALAIYGDANAMAQALGFNGINDITNKGTKVEDIVHAYSQQAGRIFAMEDVDGNDIMASIKILSVVRDMLIMVNQDPTLVKLLNDAEKPEDLQAQLIINKAVNRNVVASIVNDSVGINVDNEVFEIDVAKLQKAVTEKIVIAKKDLLEDLGAMLFSEGRGSAKMPIALMKLENARAIAAAA